MPLRLHPEATAELASASEWYERQQFGLGSDFSSDTWPMWPGLHHPPPIRRFLLPDFPFAVPYMVLEDGMVILAVTHVRRRPGYWLKRAHRLRPG